jgi:hypothetical protein
MIIWLLSLLLLACLAGLGYRQGAIRVAFSLVAILLGALLAIPMGGLLTKPLLAFGVKSLILQKLIAPLIIFVIISIIFKVAAFFVHQEVEVYYKYKAGDLRLALWERLNQRLGLCLGIVNGICYLMLLSFVVYATSYWTVPLANPDKDPKWMTVLNRLGRGLESTGFIKVARAVDPLPRVYYNMADFIAFMYHNPLQEARLIRYPGLLALAEHPEYQQLGTDKEFISLRQEMRPVMDFYEYGAVQAILGNNDLLVETWKTVEADLKDLCEYVATAKSAKYDSEPLLGRWDFSPNGSFIKVRQAKPNANAAEMKKLKAWLAQTFNKTTLVALPDHKLIIKSLPAMESVTSASMTAGVQDRRGEWKIANGGYQVVLTDGGVQEEYSLKILGDLISVRTPALEMVFERQY